MQDNEIIFWHAFNSVEGFGPQTFRKLTARFSSLREAWLAGQEELLASGISERQAKTFSEFRGNNSPEKLFEDLLKEKIGIILENAGWRILGSGG